MSIAGDTSPRVPGFNSISETTLSPRRGGVIISGAGTPNFSHNITPLLNQVTIGNSVSPLSTGTVYIGNNISTRGVNSQQSIAIGSNIISPSVSGAGDLGSVYIGNQLTAPTSGGASVVIGSNCNFASGGNNSVIIGFSTNYSPNNSVIVGNLNSIRSSGISICVGYGLTTQITTNQAVLYGISCSAGFSATNATAIGISSSSANNGTAVGNSCSSGSSGIGIGNTCSSANNGIALGTLAGNDFAGQMNICNAQFASSNDIATSILALYMQTTTATTTELAMGNGSATTAPTNRIVCTNFSTYIFDIDIVARSVGSASVACWNLKFAANRNANAASFTISSVAKTLLYTIGTVTGWDVSATADTTNGRPNISVTGAAATTINWVGNAKMTKVATAS